MPPPNFSYPNGDPAARVTPPAVLDQLVEAVCSDLKPAELLVASDFDGTLSPIVPTPGAARANPGSMTALATLVKLGVKVAVISGRSLEALRRVVTVEGVELLGDYGLEAPNEQQLAALREFNERVLAEFTGVEGIVVEPKPGSTSIHYRDNPNAGSWVYSTLRPLAESLGLMAGQGRMVVEVRPAGADKGLALGRLISRLQPRAVVFAGDDEGDRSAFAQAAGSRLRHLVVGVRSAEAAPDLFDQCDAVIAGPDEWARTLARIAAEL